MEDRREKTETFVDCHVLKAVESWEDMGVAVWDSAASRTGIGGNGSSRSARLGPWGPGSR